MSEFETCSRGFTLRLLREYRADTRAMHALHLKVCHNLGWPTRSLRQTEQAYVHAHAQHYARQWTDTNDLD